MRILVTGGSGFIGSHIIDVLLEQGHDVTNIDIKPAHRQDIKHLNGSILDRSLIDAVVRDVDAIYHIGGFSNINFVKAHPVETIELNVLSTTYLLDACRKHKVSHFIYASSVYAFDRSGHLYTTSKALSERIIEDFNSLYNITYTILRYATVYGPRNRNADVIYIFVKKAIEGDPLEIHGSGMQKRNFIHVRDLAEASVKALENTEAVNKKLVIAHSMDISILELAERVKDIVNPDIEVRFIESTRDNDYKGAVDNIEASYNILQWKPSISIENGLAEMHIDIISEMRTDVKIY